MIIFLLILTITSFLILFLKINNLKKELNTNKVLTLQLEKRIKNNKRYIKEININLRK